MGFFDNVKNSLTETSQELTQKAKDYSGSVVKTKI